jgi:hypothetical protein
MLDQLKEPAQRSRDLIGGDQRKDSDLVRCVGLTSASLNGLAGVVTFPHLIHPS